MRARPLVLCAAALGLSTLASAASPAPPGTAPADDPGTARLRREVAGLRVERDLAGGKGFYIRLDAPRQRLALMLQGVALDDYAANPVEWGVPEVLFVDRHPGADWDAAAFSKGRLEPERERDRLEVVAPPPTASPSPPGGAEPRGTGPDAASPSPPPIPKSAEETYSVPSPYRIVFAEGVSLEVRARGHGGRNRSLFRRLADAVTLRVADLGTALGLGAKERLRLQVTLEAEDAASLYRSLPPDVGLVVVGLPSR
jgi:hypothetical protein